MKEVPVGALPTSELRHRFEDRAAGELPQRTGVLRGSAHAAARGAGGGGRWRDLNSKATETQDSAVRP